MINRSRTLHIKAEIIIMSLIVTMLSPSNCSALYINSTHIQCTTPAIDSDVAVDVFVTVTLNDMPYLSSAGIFQYMRTFCSLQYRMTRY